MYAQFAKAFPQFGVTYNKQHSELLGEVFTSSSYLISIC